MQFRILGPLEVDAGGPPILLGGPKQRAVLAHLAVRVNQLVPVETLVDHLWGEEPPDSARNVIQTYISHLRKALGPDRIQSHGPGYRLRLDPSELDATRFDELLRAAKKALPVDPGVAVATLDDALTLWRGPALADLAGGASLLAEGARLDESRLEAQETRIEGLLAAGDQARAISEAQGLLAHHPWRERPWGLLMLAYYRDGRQADALNAFQRAREILAEEVGIDPSPELTRLHARILQQDPSLDLRGEPLRGYRLLEKINEGPTGIVFRAIQPHVERDVAVKVFHERIAADPEFVRHFEPNVQAVAALEHPCIVPIYDYWREPGRAYVVARYMRGGSLRAIEQRGERLEQVQALRVVEQIAVALAFAHRQGVTHGNVGPPNVLFDPEGNAYLADFLTTGGLTLDPSDDTRALAHLARRLLPDEPSLGELVERAEAGLVPGPEAFAEVVRSALDPTAPVVPRPVDVRNPYKGLRAFAEPDAPDFFGRGVLTRRLLARLTEGGSRFLAVVGPSGAGKSSVVRAGLVPAIRKGDLGDQKDAYVAEMLPGFHPMDELEAALRRIAVRPVPHLHDRLGSGSRGLLDACELVVPPGAEVVLVVDQFEEAFTLTVDERERQLFLESLRVAAADPESRCRVIVTLRADFYDRPLLYPRFGHLLAERTEAVPSLTPDELEQAIRGPAERIGVHPEPGLVAQMIADLAHQPGALPLLQYALTELFEHRDDDRLTLATYGRIGGIAGALSARADRIYESIGHEGRRATRQVFLRLVTLGEGRQDTRRRVPRSDLDHLDVGQEAIDGILDTFGRHRLLTFDREPSTREPTVEIAHEALLSAWGRLRTWIDDARTDIRQERGLTVAAAEWGGSGGDPSFLLRGARLEQLESWVETTDLAIGRPARAYLKASVDQRDREQEEERRRREREAHVERRAARRLRGLVGVLAVAALVGGSLTVVATSQGARAEREARNGKARELAATAVANLSADPELSVLLAIEAVQTTLGPDKAVLREAEEVLHRAVVGSRLELEVPGVGGALAWGAGGVFVTEGPEGSGTVDVRDSETGESLLAFPGHDGDVTDVAFSLDGSRLATTGEDGMLKVWDPDSGSLLASLSAPGRAQGPSFSADGSRVAAAWSSPNDDARVRTLDVTTEREVSKVRVPQAIDTALSPDGGHVAVAKLLPDDEAGAVFDVATGQLVHGLAGPNCCEHPSSRGVSWSPDGRLIASSSADGARVWDAETGSLRHTLVGHVASVLSVAWSPDSSRLVTGSADGTAKVWEIDPDGVRERWSLAARETEHGIEGVAFSPDGSRVMGGDGNISAVRIWDLGPTGDAEWANLPAPGYPAAEFMPDGRRIVTSSWEGHTAQEAAAEVMIWDLTTTRAARVIGPASDYFRFKAFDVSPDGSTIALGGWSDPQGFGGASAGRAWDAATGEELWRVAHDYDVNEMAFSPDGEHLATADWTGTAKIIDRRGHVVTTLGPSGGDVTFSDVAFGSDGLVATAEADDSSGRVRVWTWTPGDVVLTIDAEGRWPQVDLHPTLARVAVSGPDALAEIWDVETGERVATLAGRPGGAKDLVFSPDGSRIATAGVDGLVRLFDADTGTPLLTLPESGCDVEGVGFSSDGTKLASSSWCDGVRVWALDIDDLLDIARREARRSLTDEECRQYLRVDRCSQP